MNVVKQMQEELLPFLNYKKVWNLVDLPFVEKGNWHKVGLQNKEDERSFVVKTKPGSLYNNSLCEIQQPNGIFIARTSMYLTSVKKFDLSSIKTATTLIVSNKPLVKDEDGVDVDVHIYRSMIGSLMYLTASRPDIMFIVCACARFPNVFLVVKEDIICS
ncbi:hypothetical protein Tco_1068026 [Tanacetum coccineum]|uniref:Uncharacterized protein n=1 Tax=Tanacetum coccineum TaxID=301880 RepID=A0ABQ5HFW1_9ASTR